MTTLHWKLLRDLLHMKGQVVAVGMIVACGIASFVTARSAFESLLASQTAYYRAYRFADVFASLERAPAALARRLQDIPGVDVIDTRVIAEVTITVPGLEEPATARLVSIPARGEPRLNRLHLRRGRLLDPERRNEVLVSEAFATANHLDPGDRIGAVLNGRWEELVVAGVALSPEYVYVIRGGGSILPDDRRFGIFWMNRDALGPAFDMEGGFNDVALTLQRGASAPEVVAALDRLLEPYGGLGAYPREDQISNAFLSNEFDELRAWGRLMPAIFLGVAAFLLHIVLSRLIAIQRDQIAVLKAFGYSNGAVGWHYVELALVMISLGAAAGLGLGLWLGASMTSMYAGFFRFPLLRYEAGTRVLLPALAVAVGAGLLGVVGSVRRAVSLPPAEAMRPEPPPRFHRGAIERSRLFVRLHPAAKILVRNMVRRPARLFLSIFAISLAVAIMVVGRYFMDAIDWMMDVQFRTVSREQVAITFLHPESGRAFHEVQHLPGVLYAEPFRTVPVELIFEHRRERTALVGLRPDARLRRVIDQRLRRVALPPDGVVLTTYLAETLGVRPGDFVTVKVLEGERALRPLPVVALVDELLGQSAYMDIAALNRFLREGSSLSGAYLSVDPLESDRLYRVLKRTPAVAGVAIREATVASFEETIGRTFGTFTSILVLLASVIALGMVYNGARIALSERGRELASLRVLGFTRGEVALMLLGEQALITVMAIPLGFAIGYAIAALITRAYDSELFRMPLVVTPSTYGFALVVVTLATTLSALIVNRRIHRLDLVEVLKTRE